MAKLSPADKETIRLQTSGLTGWELRNEVRELADSYGVSESTIYRCGTNRKVTSRNTKGIRKIDVGEYALSQMRAFTISTNLPARNVIKIFEENGLIPRGTISPEWYNRHLKSYHMSRRDMNKDLRPCRRFESSEPGEMYQIDATVALQYYIDDDGSVQWESTVSANKNRPGNQKRRLNIIAAMDDYTLGYKSTIKLI